ncbi:MAG: hypothetical protein IPN29_08645 [Saprospiraceae bacterium]|nr:hypothetical protein [Saprospiraceae bacterium]
MSRLELSKIINCLFVLNYRNFLLTIFFLIHYSIEIISQNSIFTYRSIIAPVSEEKQRIINYIYSIPNTSEKYFITIESDSIAESGLVSLYLPELQSEIFQFSVIDIFNTDDSNFMLAATGPNGNFTLFNYEGFIGDQLK